MFEISRKVLSRQFFEAIRMHGWNAVPRLGLPAVDIVNAIQIHVFGVPSKRCLPHPKVQICRIDPLDLCPSRLHKRVHSLLILWNQRPEIDMLHVNNINSSKRMGLNVDNETV